jgi:hypothetical protein
MGRDTARAAASDARFGFFYLKLSPPACIAVVVTHANHEQKRASRRALQVIERSRSVFRPGLVER